MFTHALVRTPDASLTRGLSSAGLGSPDPGLAARQHAAYVAALRGLGAAVTVLPAESRYPDSVFIEDTAVLAERCAVITRPGAPSRQGEEESVAVELARFYPECARIEPPGTLEGGDVMRAGDHFFIGLSGRTNQAGADQLIRILNRVGYSGSTIRLGELLHLKTGVSYLEGGLVLASGALALHPDLQRFRILPVPAAEAYAANCLWFNGTVLVPAGFPGVRRLIEEAGLPVQILDTSEFRKVDGGLSCLSLRFSLGVAEASAIGGTSLAGPTS